MSNGPSSILIEGDIYIKTSEKIVHFMFYINHPSNLVSLSLLGAMRESLRKRLSPGITCTIIHPKSTFTPMFNIGNRGKWLRNPVDIKEANKQAKIYIGRSLTLHSHLFCYAHRLCMTYIIAMLLSVSCMSTRNHLLSSVRFCAGSDPKTANKNRQQRTLPSFLTISLN